MVGAGMSSRSEGKKAAREARLAAEQEQAEGTRRQRIWALAGSAVLLAAIVVIALIVISSGDSSDDSGTETDVALFDGIPQSGIELGDPDAPVTLVEFADMQCPFCADYTVEDMPALVTDYVKSGDLRMELNLLAFIGPDSETLARAAYAASEQDLMWQFTDIAYARQGAENSGYADQEFVDGVAASAGVDVAQMNEAVETEAVTGLLEDAQAATADAGIESTPSFLVGPTGGSLEEVALEDLGAAIEEIAAE